uniref:Cl574_1 n=1 Tax=Arundo donax TaxID=35708 RepID=A0A0A9DA54_ARUDO
MNSVTVKLKLFLHLCNDLQSISISNELAFDRDPTSAFRNIYVHNNAYMNAIEVFFLCLWGGRGRLQENFMIISITYVNHSPSHSAKSILDRWFSMMIG